MGVFAGKGVILRPAVEGCQGEIVERKVMRSEQRGERDENVVRGGGWKGNNKNIEKRFGVFKGKNYLCNPKTEDSLAQLVEHLTLNQGV